MKLKHDGLAKVVEECGAVMLTIGKMLEYPGIAESLDKRLELEFGHLQAAMFYAIRKRGINLNAVNERMHDRVSLYKKLDAQENDRRPTTRT